MKSLYKVLLTAACTLYVQESYGDIKEFIKASYNNNLTTVINERSGLLNQDEYKTAQDLNIPGNSYELNALSAAALRGHENIINQLMTETLLEQPSNINTQNRLGQTPLMFAVMGGHADIAKLLVEKYQADINMQDADGDTALMYVLTQAEHATSDQDDQLFEIFKMLLEHHADVNKQSKTTKQTALFLAVNLPETKKRYLEALLQKNPDLEIKDNSQKTALQIALENKKATFAALIQKAKPLPVPPPPAPVPAPEPTPTPPAPTPTPAPVPVVPQPPAPREEIDTLKNSLQILTKTLHSVGAQLARTQAAIAAPKPIPAPAPEASGELPEPAIEPGQPQKLVVPKRATGPAGRKLPSRKKPPTQPEQ